MSKRLRMKLMAIGGEAFVFFPKLPDRIQSEYRRIFGHSAPEYILTHLRRELMHKVWELLLDDEFVHYYFHGMIVTCVDGVQRLVFPRFFAYLADYPERVLLATIRSLGRCPCASCLIEKQHISRLGQIFSRKRALTGRVDTDRRRKAVELSRALMFKSGYSVRSQAVERLLEPTSLVPTRNAFSERLSPSGFDFFQMFKPGIMHEIEGGVWKAVFRHIVRILYHLGEDRIAIMNERFRKVPSFGRNSIRRFKHRTSVMAHFACRDWEDILQCAMPVLEGLFPDETMDQIVQVLAFSMGRFHAFSKLHLSIRGATTEKFDAATTQLGQALRRFDVGVCQQFEVRELPQEETSFKGAPRKSKKGKERADTVKTVQFSLRTAKIAALEHYVPTLRYWSTLDHYNEQLGEMHHRRFKDMHKRTNKRSYVQQIAARERLIRYLEAEHARVERGPALILDVCDDEDVPLGTASAPYHVAQDRKAHETLRDWLPPLEVLDPAVHLFDVRLSEYLLAILLDTASQYQGFTSDQRRGLDIRNDRIYKHKILRCNFGTYDMRLDQDSLNSGNRDYRDFAVLNGDRDSSDDHPYLYGRVVAILHVDARYVGPGSYSAEYERIDMCYVRWFRLDDPGWARKRLPRLQFYMHNDPDVDAFGFIHPSDIVRGAHIIPAFAHGLTRKFLPYKKSIAHVPLPLQTRPELRDEVGHDYVYYYLGGFSDRDWFSRMEGDGVGHCLESAELFAADAGGPEDVYLIDMDEGDEWGDEGEPIAIESLTDATFSAALATAADTEIARPEDEADVAAREIEIEEYGYGDFAGAASDEEREIDDLGAEDGQGKIADDTDDLGYPSW